MMTTSEVPTSEVMKYGFRVKVEGKVPVSGYALAPTKIDIGGEEVVVLTRVQLDGNGVLGVSFYLIVGEEITGGLEVK